MVFSLSLYLKVSIIFSGVNPAPGFSRDITSDAFCANSCLLAFCCSGVSPISLVLWPATASLKFLLFPWPLNKALKLAASFCAFAAYSGFPTFSIISNILSCGPLFACSISCILFRALLALVPSVANLFRALAKLSLSFFNPTKLAVAFCPLPVGSLGPLPAATSSA